METLIGITINTKIEINYIGWQNARAIIHEQYTAFSTSFYYNRYSKINNIYDYLVKINFIKIIFCFFRPLIMRFIFTITTLFNIIFHPIKNRSNRYWIYCYFVFLSLAILCFILAFNLDSDKSD